MKPLYILFYFLLASTLTFSQPNVDICVENTGTALEVKVQPDALFDGFVANIQFTIRSSDPTVTFGTPSGILAYIPMAKASGTVVSSGSAYQKFSGFGTLAMSALGESWTSGEVVTLFSVVPSSLAATFEISTDTWTTDNNGLYYTELNAIDKTGAIALCGTFLPVEGWQFSVEKAGVRSARLVWQTLREHNSDYFAIEKRIDGGSFEEIARIQAAGYSESQQSYQFVDHGNMGTVNDYRIRQVDLNGAFVWSDVETIRWEGSFLGQFFPNPASESSHLVIQTTRSGQLHLQFFNVLGQEIERRAFTLSPGKQTVTIPVGHLTQGIYYVHIQENGVSKGMRELTIY